MPISEKDDHHLPFPRDRPVRVSLDMESVLADVHSYFLSAYNDEFGTTYNRNDIDSWDWVRTEIDFEDFDRIVNEGWCEYRHNIEPMEPGLDAVVAELASHDDVSVDIVTARTGVESAMRQWLAGNEIDAYDRFYSTTTSKADLDYDLYIDDKPGLADNLQTEQIQYLVRGPHNSVAVDHPQTRPVQTVTDAVAEILQTL